ncbi:MAG: hypothetical protein ABI388_04700 [Bacteroidia bacterium]
MRAFFIPFSHDETLTFFSYIQTNDYLPYKAHIDANNHILNSCLANLCYQIAGSHPFVLRVPNVLAFILLCIGIFKHFKYLKTIYSKIILVTFFILTLNFLDFFELCRGYGLSFGFIVLGLAYLMDYFSSKKTKYFALFLLCFQLALAANLIILALLSILIVLILIFQFKNKLLINFLTIGIYAINISVLIFWVKFSFFYKEHNAFYTGAGDSYWDVTFKSLMLLFFWTDRLWMQISIICLFLALFIFLIKNFFQRPVSINKIFTPQLFYIITLVIVIVAFYLQKKILQVNFPENRTAVFYYLLFVLGIAFAIDTISPKIASKISLLLLIPSCVFFIVTYNLYNFSFWFYNTIPKSFYYTIKSEAQKNNEEVSVGGNLWKGSSYTFLNYRDGSTLNNINSIYQMTMNCDYYIAMKNEKTYYKYFYDEIASEDTWNMVLLKRKEKIERHQIYKAMDAPKNLSGDGEFFNLFSIKDSTLGGKNCIEASIEVKFNNVPVPACANIVLQINTNKDEVICYKTVLVNWLGDDLNKKIKKIKLISSKLPANTNYIAVYLWNPKRNKMDFTMSETKIFELKGKGVGFMIPDSYYKYLETINSTPF